jgi:hypothetical protein
MNDTETNPTDADYLCGPILFHILSSDFNVISPVQSLSTKPGSIPSPVSVVRPVSSSVVDIYSAAVSTGLRDTEGEFSTIRTFFTGNYFEFSSVEKSNGEHKY